MSLLDPLVHIQQVTLAQLGIVVPQAELAQILGTRVGVGTPFSRVERLARWNVYVRLTRQASIDDLVASLAADVAVIVAVTTTPGLPGWGNIRTQHTVLVVSTNTERITSGRATSRSK